VRPLRGKRNQNKEKSRSYAERRLPSAPPLHERAIARGRGRVPWHTPGVPSKPQASQISRRGVPTAGFGMREPKRQCSLDTDK